MDSEPQDLTFDQVNAILKRLGGKEGALSFLRDEMVIVPKPRPTRFAIWKTIKLGIFFEKVDDFREAVRRPGSRFNTDGTFTNYMVGKVLFRALIQQMEIDLVNPTVGELGFKESADFQDICSSARKWGLDLCPQEAGVQLRLQYEEQPEDEVLAIGMDPICDSNDIRLIFVLLHSGGTLWLLNTEVLPKVLFPISARFVFVCPRCK